MRLTEDDYWDDCIKMAIEVSEALRNSRQQVHSLREALAEITRAFEFYVESGNDGWLSAGGLDRMRDAIVLKTASIDAVLSGLDRSLSQNRGAE